MNGDVPPRSLAVVGAGWAGLAAAVRGVQAGWQVSLYEMAPRPGGRARGVAHAGHPDYRLDNGQHILIGAYTRTLALMQQVGADAAALLHRQPLALVGPDGRGLRLPSGPALPAFVRGVLAARHWTAAERLSLLATAAGWLLRGFRCDPPLSVAQLCAGLPAVVRAELVDPLCVAALNTEAHEASAQVFLRVLRDALFAGPGAADLLLPRAPLDALLPAPAWAWLRAQGASLHTGHRVEALQARPGGGWALDGQPYDAVLLACSATEAARLARPHAPAWAETAAALPYEPIVTVYLQADGARLPAALTALPAGPREPAQFVLDHGAVGGAPGLLAFVISGARPWVEAGLEATAAAVLAQARRQLPALGTPRLVRALAEKRATFRCVPGLLRPAQAIAPALLAAGDFVAGPYPSTLEGAVRSGEQAVAALAPLGPPRA